MREQSCDDGEDAQRAHEAQGQVAPVPCFRPVSPCYFRQATPPRPAPGCARFLFSSWSLRRNHRRQVVPGVSCFSAVIYRNRRLGLTLWLRHEARKWLTPDARQKRVYARLRRAMRGHERKKELAWTWRLLLLFLSRSPLSSAAACTPWLQFRGQIAPPEPSIKLNQSLYNQQLNTILNTIRKRLNGDRSNCVFGFVWRKMP